MNAKNSVWDVRRSRSPCLREAVFHKPSKEHKLAEAILLTLAVGLIALLMYYLCRSVKSEEERSLGIFAYKENLASTATAMKPGEV